jgi:hypothetical protein
MSEKCPVCNTDIEKPTPSIPDGRHLESFSCRRCGDFTLDTKVLRPDMLRDAVLKGDITKIAKLSHWIRTRHESLIREGPDDQHWRKANMLDNESVKSALNAELTGAIIRNPRLSLKWQADNFVRWIGDTVNVGGQYIDVDKYAVQAIAGSATFEEFELVFRHLRDKGLIEHKTGAGNIWVKATLSFAGWERYEELKLGHTDSLRAFMAMQYKNKQLADIFESVFRDAVAKTGFDLFRLVDTPQPAGLIDDDLQVRIRASRFLIADLTDGNAGAYWEAGYAEGLGKPVIYTCERKVFEAPQSRPHFDTNHHLTILWDPDKPQEAGEKLKATIRATLPAEAKLTDD